MQQRISVLTMAADDLLAIKNFYSKTLGWKIEAENNEIIFYRMNGFLLSFCDRRFLSEFIGLGPAGKGFNGVTIGYNVSSKEEVIEYYERLKDKVEIIKELTEPDFGGMFFYFFDVEKNVIEIAHNPYVFMDENRNATGHKPIELL